MKIDIDQLTEAELAELNHRIVARIRFLRDITVVTDDGAQWNVSPNFFRKASGKDRNIGGPERYTNRQGMSDCGPLPSATPKLATTALFH